MVPAAQASSRLTSNLLGNKVTETIFVAARIK